MRRAYERKRPTESRCEGLDARVARRISIQVEELESVRKKLSGKHFRGKLLPESLPIFAVSECRFPPPLSASAMPLLLRSSMERRHMKKAALVLMHLAIAAGVASVPAAAQFYANGAMALGRMVMQPSRRWSCAHARACTSRTRMRCTATRASHAP